MTANNDNPFLPNFGGPLEDPEARAARIEGERRPRRIERRTVFGHLTGEYRVSEAFPATYDDAMAGRAERLDPQDDDSPLIAWKGVCQWVTLKESVDPYVEFSGLLDPCKAVN